MVGQVDQQISGVRELLRSRPLPIRQSLDRTVKANAALFSGQMPIGAPQAFAFGVLAAVNTIMAELDGFDVSAELCAQLYGVADNLLATAVQFHTGRSPFERTPK